MDKKYKKSLFIFRRDLRLHENTALIEALKSSVKVIACFIFDPRQVGKNPYRSNNAIHKMIFSGMLNGIAKHTILLVQKEKLAVISGFFNIGETNVSTK